MRPEKQALADQFCAELKEASFIIFTNYRGWPVATTELLRRRLGEVGATYRVMKNRLLRRAAEEVGLPCIDAHLAGPNGLVLGRGDPVETAKILRAFVMEHDSRSAIKAGVLEGSLLDPGEVGALATMPSRQVLLAMLLGTLAAPMRGLAGVLHQKTASLVYVLKAVEDKINHRE